MRVGISSLRRNGNTPAVNGNRPGTFSSSIQRKRSPALWYFGSAIFGIRVPDRLSRYSGTRYSLSRTV